MGIAAAVMACAYLYLRLDDEIRRYAEELLANHYTELRVQVGSARFVQGRGITIYDLAIADPKAPESQRTLMHIDELQLAGNFGTKEVLSGAPTIERIVVKRPQAFAHRRHDGTWSFDRLLPLPKFGEFTPQIQLIDASIVISDEGAPHMLPLVINDLDIEVHRAAKTPGAAPAWQVYGSTGRPLAEKITFSGELDPTTGQLDCKCKVVKLDVTRELMASVPVLGLESLQGLDLQGRADFELEAHRAAGTDAPLKWEVKNFRLTSGRLSHPRLPRRISELQAEGQCDQDGLFLRTCTGKYGTTDVVLACRRTGWSSSAPMGIRARAIDLPLDKQLESSLPPGLWRWWDRFRPAGTVTATAEVKFDGSRWLPDVTVECQQVSFQDNEKFPYRMQNATGTVRYFDVGGPHGAEMTLNLQPTMQNEPVQVTGHFAGLPTFEQIDASLPPPTGNIKVVGQNIRFHPELLDAMEAKFAKYAEVVRSLHPSGQFSFDWRAERTSPEQVLMATTLTLDLLDGSFQYDHFPYPLTQVTGQVIARDKHWTFQNLVAKDARSERVVRGSGALTPTEAGALLQFTIHGTDVPLDNDLRSALKPELQELWTKLRPQGRIDLAAQVTHQVGRQEKPRVEVWIEDAERTVLIEATFFPFRLEQLGGKVHVSPERIVTLENIRARHGQMEMFTQGGWRPLENGGWEFQLKGLHVARLTPSHDLVAAVPIELRKVLEQLKPEGNFAIQGGNLQFAKPSAHDPRFDTHWDLILDCHQADLHAGMPLNDIFGQVRLVGSNVNEQCSTVGELQIDSLVWRDFQFTSVRGPMWCDRAQCLFGQGATEKLDQPPRSIEAQTSGGAIVLNANVMHDGYPRYGLSAAVRDLDLARFANEHLNNQGDLSGRVQGELRLQGNGTSIHGLTGAGKLTVEDANLYELPLLVSLLKVLRNRAPDTTAFNRVESEFHIHGDRINLRKLDLLGDAVSFYGRGDAYFNRRIDLAFHSIIGQNELSIPILKSFVGQASEQVLQLAVDGTIDDPQTHPKAFPGVSEMLEQLQNDINGPKLPSAAQRPQLSPPR